MIHVFGDSFSEDYKCTFKEDGSYIWRYIDYLGRDIKLYCDLLSEHLNQPITNHSIGGICNENIFMLFMENFSKIKPNDIVIFGWTELFRFLTPHEIGPDNYIWRSNIYPNNFLSQRTKEEMLVMLDHKLYRKKQMDTIKFIEEILPNNITINWTWCTVPSEFTSTIKKETNGLIDDFHYGEEGHRHLFNKIKEQLEVTNRVRIDLWDQVEWSKFYNF
jgi:hypothetical protein